MKDSDQNFADDYDFSRRVYYDLISKGQEALDRMMDVADETAHPRSYEVLAGMIKNISDVNDRLMDIHKKKRDIKQIGKVQPKELPVPGTTNNTLVVTATELQRMLIENSPENNIIDITDHKQNE